MTRRNTTDDKKELVNCVEPGNISKANKLAAGECPAFCSCEWVCAIIHQTHPSVQRNGSDLFWQLLGVPSALWKLPVLPSACFATDLLSMALSNTKSAAYCRSVCMCETLMF